MEGSRFITIFVMRIRYENLKKLGSCFSAFCLLADGYAFGVGPTFFMNHLSIEKSAENFGLYGRNWERVKDADYPIFISDKGELISFAKYPNGRLLKVTPQKDFYPVLNLRMNGKKGTKLLHRLLAIAFIPNPENKPQINHKDGDKTNYSIENLEWVTDKENKQHGHRTGLFNHPKGYDSKMSKPILQLTLSGEFVKEWPCTEEIIRQTKFQGPHIRRVANGIRKTAYGFLWRFK